MLTKEQLNKTVLKYSSEITEEVFNKIIDRFEKI